jgi:antitoxin ParD1/3/4
MTTLNVSMPESMREYIESVASKEKYSSSEYIRHLIREDQKRHQKEENNLLWNYLTLSARQLDDEDFSNLTMNDILTQGRKRRKQKGKE